MESPILINARLKMKRSAIEANATKLVELEDKKAELLRAADDATDEKALDDVSKEAGSVDDQIKKLKDDTDTLTQDIADLEKALEDNNDDSKGSDPKYDSPAPKTNSKKGGEIRMNNKTDKQVRGLIDYFNSKGQKRDGITTTAYGALIPKDIIYSAQDEIKTMYDLTKFVDVRNTKMSSGTFNVLKKIDESLHTVAELEANPELKNPEPITANWAVETYRGSILQSIEAIEDVTELKAMISDALSQYVMNTKNRLIADILKTATASSATDTDGIKKIVNVDLDPAYNKSIITTQSGFQFLDTLKDNDGRYLMQPDVTSPTGYRFLGMVVQPVADTLLGAQGDALAFIGDAKRFVKFFDRQEVQIGWAVNDVFGEDTLAAIRVDAEAVDTNAGYLVTLGPKA